MRSRVTSDGCRVPLFRRSALVIQSAICNYIRMSQEPHGMVQLQAVPNAYEELTQPYAACSNLATANTTCA